MSLYLTRDQLVHTLSVAASLAPAGSVLLMDLYSSEMVAASQRPFARRMLALTDEEIHFGVELRHSPWTTLMSF